MGWDGMIKTKAPMQHLLEDVLTGSNVLNAVQVDGTFYVAYRQKDEVFGVVVLCEQHYEDGVCWIDFKVMDETMKPFYYDCPRAILDRLSPTTNHNALEWREEQFCNREE
jgi:hypothetical protein